MILKTGLGSVPASVAVRTPAAVTRQVRSVGGECQQAGFRIALEYSFSLEYSFRIVIQFGTVIL